MIQELLGGMVEERKISHLIDPSLASPTSSICSPSPSRSFSSLTSATTEQQQQQQLNLRCPRCDSTNTKLCYYNNYNLTQPRHFCKTCRRYWTKGGALRNVPIGGGCRKAKVAPTITASCGKPGAGKFKPEVVSDLLMRSGLTRGLENELWSLPHTSQLMSLLRSSTIGNPNLNLNSSPVLNLNSSRVKEDKPLLGVHTSMSHNAHSINLDPSNQLGLGSSPWRNGSHYSMQPRLEQPQHNDNTFLSDKPNSEMQDLFQKLKSSANYHNEQLQTVMSDVARFDSSYATSSVMNAANSMATSILTPTMEPIPLFVGELGCWNPALAAWPDLPTRYGAFQ